MDWGRTSSSWRLDRVGYAHFRASLLAGQGLISIGNTWVILLMSDSGAPGPRSNVDLRHHTLSIPQGFWYLAEAIIDN